MITTKMDYYFILVVPIKYVGNNTIYVLIGGILKKKIHNNPSSADKLSIFSGNTLYKSHVKFNEYKPKTI